MNEIFLFFQGLVQWLYQHVLFVFNTMPLYASNPLTGALFLFVNGAWIPVVYAALLAFRELWKDYLGGKWAASQKYLLLAIDVPKMNEQSPKAVENIFSAIAGAGGSPDFFDKYWKGWGPNQFSFEIVSNAGHIQFYIRTRDKLRDLVEAAVYSQYPNAEIQVVEDYVKEVPSVWPNPDYDLLGTDMVLANKEAFPIKTYPNFEDTLMGEFKDPIANVIEALNKLGPGEQLWMQLCVTPSDGSWKKESENVVKKLVGQPVEADKKQKSFLLELLEIPVQLIGEFITALTGLGAAAPAKKDDAKQQRFLLTPLEREQLDAVGQKATKLGFKSKLRLIYIAKKANSRGGGRLGEVRAALNAFNAQNLNSFKGHGNSAIKMTYWWQKRMIAYYLTFGMYRPAPIRQFFLFNAAKGRSIGKIAPPYILGVEELATLWHFPTIAIKSPLLRKIESKRSEAPFAVPFRDDLPKPPEPPAPKAAPAPTAAEKQATSIPENLPFA